MLGPDPSRPPSVADRAQPYANAPLSHDANHAADPNRPPPDVSRWWTAFDDPQLDALVNRALQRNTDLRGAAARVAEARALLGVALGRRLPRVDVGAGRERRQNTFEFTDSRFSSRSTTWTAQGTVAWQADLFGRLRRGQQRAQLDFESSAADRRAVVHSVIAAVVRQRARLAVYQRQLELASETVDSFKRTLDVTEQRYDAGVAGALELRLARENLAGARAQVPEFEYLAARTRHALDVLIARQPGAGEPVSDTLAELPPLDTPPPGLPVWLLERRPDLRATELAAMAEQAGIGQSLAELLPDLAISASGGYQGSDFEDMYPAPETLIWSLATELSMKLFQGGALRANVQVSKARAKAAAAQYAGAVLNAMREVENALARERTARQRYAELRDRLSEARQAERLAHQRYETGVTDLLTVLEVERRRREAQDQLYATQLTLWEARVDLHLALGGDWVNDPPPPEADSHAQAKDEQR